MANYDVIFLGGIPERRYHFMSAPTDAKLCDTGTRLKAQFAVRYFPSRKGWLVLDLRRARRVQTASHRNFWRGQERLQQVCPTEDAAVMLAYHAAMRCPELDIS